MVISRAKTATLCLMAGMFFNPFGYDAAFKLVLDLTGSYWTTAGIFYLIAASFFGLYFYFAGFNPLRRAGKLLRSIFGRVA